MAKMSVVGGTTSLSINVFIQDSTSTTGAGKTGLAWNTAGLTAYYERPGSASVAITLATQTVTGAYSSGGFVEVDSVNMPGVYRFDVPNAVIAAGVKSAVVFFQGATGMAQLPLEFAITAVDNQNATSFGLANLDTNVGSRMATFTLPANFSSLLIDGTGRVTLAPSQIFYKKNTGPQQLSFFMTDSTTHAPKTGLTVSATRSIDGAAFAACANAVVEIGNGWYTIALAAADLNGLAIAFRATAAGADDRPLLIVTQE